MSFVKFLPVVSLLCVFANVSVHGQNSPSAAEILDLYVRSPYSPPVSSAGIIVDSSEVSNIISDRYDLASIGSMCPKDALYSSFHPEHARAVDTVTRYLAEQKTDLDFFNLASVLKSSNDIHPKVWYAAVTRARLVVNLPLTEGTNTVGPIDLFPTTFFPAEVVQASLNSPEKCVYLDEGFGADNGIENKLWYFREDVQLNGHHWVWHLLNPWNSFNVTKTIDRRGEFFYFFHRDLLARYAAERLSNGFAFQKPLNLHQDTILEEGYNSHLTEGISNRTYPPRRPFRPFYESLTSSEKDIFKRVVRERDRVVDAITQGGILHENGFLELKAFDRINALGDITEASISSVNTNIYGTVGFHNQGHDIISYVDATPKTTDSDPGGNNPRDETHGVMGGVDTTMRDIIFNRWHKMVDLIFQAYKLTHLKPYNPRGGEYPLVFDGIKVNSVHIVPDKEPNKLASPSPVNHLETFWSVRSFDLGSGLDFVNKRTLNICAKHLDHQEFEYHINLENSLPTPKLATVRIFLAPRFKLEQNKRYTMQEQRPLFFTLDSFQITLPPGHHVLSRKSTDSTLTTDWPKSFKEIQEEIATGVKLRSVCDCGFPHHLLLPKGTSDGMVFDLFVMLTDGVKDQVRNNATTKPPNYECTPSHIHCGLRGQKYPDSKPMGYPFDRRPYSKPLVIYSSSGLHNIGHRVVENLEEYVADIPNMHASQIVIHHRNEIREKVPRQHN